MKIVFGIAFALGAIALVLFLLAFITQWAWNIFLPPVFGLPAIDIWQAFGLNLLISIVASVFTRSDKK